MQTGRRTSDWRIEAQDRPEGDRRGGDRRAPRRTIDPLFAATLVNQIAPAEDVVPASAVPYFSQSPSPRGGRILNTRA